MDPSARCGGRIGITPRRELFPRPMLNAASGGCSRARCRRRRRRHHLAHSDGCSRARSHRVLQHSVRASPPSPPSPSPLSTPAQATVSDRGGPSRQHEQVPVVVHHADLLRAVGKQLTGTAGLAAAPLQRRLARARAAAAAAMRYPYADPPRSAHHSGRSSRTRYPRA